MASVNPGVLMRHIYLQLVIHRKQMIQFCYGKRLMIQKAIIY